MGWDAGFVIGPPFFQILFEFRNVPRDSIRLPNLEIRPSRFDPGVARFDLSVDIFEEDGAFWCAFDYNTDIFNAIRIERMANHYRILLEAAVKDPEMGILLGEIRKQMSLREKTRAELEELRRGEPDEARGDGGNLRGREAHAARRRRTGAAARHGAGQIPDRSRLRGQARARRALPGAVAREAHRRPDRAQGAAEAGGNRPPDMTGNQIEGTSWGEKGNKSECPFCLDLLEGHW